MSKKAWWGIFMLVGLLAVCCGCDRSSNKATPKQVTIGAILPLTGSAAELAIQHRRGLEFAIDQLNRVGGVDGKRLVLIVEDDQNDSKMTVAAFRKLIVTDKAQVVVTVMSGPSMAIAPIADQEDIILFANCGHAQVTTLHKNVFRNFPSSNLEVRRMAAFAAEPLKLKRLWLLYIDDAYGQGARDIALKEFPARGIEVLGTDGYGKTGVDIRSALVRVVSQSPDAVYVYGYGKATADVVNQLREVGYKGTLLGSYNFSQPPVTTVSKDGIEGSYYTVPNFSYGTTAQGAAFLDSYRDKYSEDPLWNGAVEYDAILIIARALEIAVKEKVSLQAALRRVGSFVGVAGEYEYDPTSKDWLTPMSIAHVASGTVEYVK